VNNKLKKDLVSFELQFLYLPGKTGEGHKIPVTIASLPAKV
jgi:hypothetical protein